MKPSLFSWLLNVNSDANQMNVASTSPCPAMSLGVSTLVASMIPSPRNATAVGSTCRVLASPHSTTMPRKVIPTTFWSRVRGPSSASVLRASAGAFGMAVTSGLMILYKRNGTRTIARSVGTTDATSHEPKPMFTPLFLAISAPSGLPAIAVSHSAEDSVRLAMPENIRNLPRRLRSSRSGVAPAASAMEKTSG